MSSKIDPSISFIIPVLNGERFIDPCLDHLEAEWRKGDEIIVVDNGSTDGTLEAARQRAHLDILEIPGITIAEMRNRGAERAKHDILAFIDVDCLLMPGWRNAAILTLSQDSVSATGSKYDIPHDATWIERAWFSNRVSTPSAAHYINSGNLVVLRDGFDRIGGFDASLITDEDYDFGSRFRDAGLNMVEDPALRVVHLGNAKTLSAFFHKTCWHSTSGMNLRTAEGHLDKPMVMTFAFIGCSVAAAAIVLLGGANARSIIAGLLALLAVPAITSVYRTLQYRNMKQFPQLTLLHTVWYFARAVTFVKSRIGPERAA